MHGPLGALSRCEADVGSGCGLLAVCQSVLVPWHEHIRTLCAHMWAEVL